MDPHRLSPLDGGTRLEIEQCDGGLLRLAANADTREALERGGATRGAWANADWLYCRDEKFRPVESGTFPLAYGLPARVGRLRGYGNAIVPQVAAQFISAYLDCRGEVK